MAPSRLQKTELVPPETVERAIFVLRGVNVILDSDLARLYGVTTARFNEQVRRNAERFPSDFTFRLTQDEFKSLRSQIAILNAGRGRHRKYLPRVFTEHGAIMAASVLSSAEAVEMSILVVRAFVRLRGIVVTHRQLAAKLNELEQKYATHDEQIVALFDAFRELMAPPAGPKRRIGFRSEGI